MMSMNNTNTNHDRSSRRSSRNTTIVSRMEAVLEMDRTSAEFQSQGFPLKLFVMLEDAPAQNFEHVIAWSPDGASFRIRNPEAFAQGIMPRYFRHQTKYKSFQRQLNIYGFRKVSLGPSKGAYSHELFLRHQPGFAHRIERKPPAAHTIMTNTRPAFAPPSPRIRDSLLSAADFVSPPPPRPMRPHHNFYPTDTISSFPARPAQHEEDPSSHSLMRNWTFPVAASTNGRDLVDHEKVTAASESLLTTRVSPLTSTKRPPASFEAPRAIRSSEQSSEANSYYYHYNHSTYVRLPPPPVYPRGEEGTDASTRYYHHHHSYPYPHQHQQYHDPYYQQQYQNSTHQHQHYGSDEVAVHGDMSKAFRPPPPPLSTTTSMISNNGKDIPGTTKSFSPCNVDEILAGDDGNDPTSPSSLLGGEGEEEEEDEMESPTAGDKPWQASGGGTDEHHRYSFPMKLYQMLEDSSRDGFSDICSWVQDGTAFKVHNIGDFMAHVSHKYFDHSKYESLRRQLNLYNFHRVSKGPDRGTYSHPLFRRGHRDLCRKIERSYAISNSPGQDTDNLEKIDNDDSIVLQAGDDSSSPRLPQNVPSQNANCYRLDGNNHWRKGPRVAYSFDQMTARNTRIHQREEEPNFSPHPT